MAAWREEDQWCVVAVGALGTAIIVSASEFIRSDLDDVGSEFCEDQYFTTDAPKEPGTYRWDGVIVGDDSKWCGSEPIEPWAEMRGEWKPIPDPVPDLEARIAELEGELSRLKVFAGRVARSGHSSFCSCYECETVRVMCPAEGQYDRQGKWQWKPPTPAAAKEQ